MAAYTYFQEKVISFLLDVAEKPCSSHLQFKNEIINPPLKIQKA